MVTVVTVMARGEVHTMLCTAIPKLNSTVPPPRMTFKYVRLVGAAVSRATVSPARNTMDPGFPLNPWCHAPAMSPLDSAGKRDAPPALKAGLPPTPTNSPAKLTPGASRDR
jgi:hypothetical protein